MPTCERNCEWPKGTRSIQCPEFGGKIYASWCERARTRENFFRVFHENGLPSKRLSRKQEINRQKKWLEKLPDEIKETAKELSIGKLSQRWITAIRKWCVAGKPVRSPETIKKIFEECCAPCDYFDAKQGRCKQCGCKVSVEGPKILGIIIINMAMFNKIKMATEWCRVWKKVTRKFRKR